MCLIVAPRAGICGASAFYEMDAPVAATVGRRKGRKQSHGGAAYGERIGPHGHPLRWFRPHREKGVHGVRAAHCRPLAGHHFKEMVVVVHSLHEDTAVPCNLEVDNRNFLLHSLEIVF